MITLAMKEIRVYADWLNTQYPQKMGLLRAEAVRGEEIFSFEYDKSWLEGDQIQLIDPDLKFFSGPQYISDDKPNFGLFLDSSPDRWGRTLMRRREAMLAKKEDRPEKRLFESDYLLGVNDVSRSGAIRFKLEENGNFLDDDKYFPTPPMSSIRELEQASLKLEGENFFEDKEAEKWLSLLMAPGSSLGGARPKASVRDPEGHLWIAKFPSKKDDKNVGAWEFVVNQLAQEVGLSVAYCDAKVFSHSYHTFLTKRFDRDQNGNRIHFASAMTLLGYKDGVGQREGVSYLELVDCLETYGAAPELDLPELWRRITFFILVSNTDDHLRNHGFLLTPKGWRLSPAYDINPNEEGTGLSLNISENSNALDLSLARNVAEYFRVSAEEAEAFIDSAQNILKSWKSKAKRLGISSTEVGMMRPAFST